MNLWNPHIHRLFFNLLEIRIKLRYPDQAVYTSHPAGTPEQMMDEAPDIFYHGVSRQP